MLPCGSRSARWHAQPVTRMRPTVASRRASTRRGVSDAGRGGNYAVATHSAVGYVWERSYALARSTAAAVPEKVATRRGTYRAPALAARQSPLSACPREQRPDLDVLRRPSTEKALRSTPSRVIPSRWATAMLRWLSTRSATRPGSGPARRAPGRSVRAARSSAVPCASGASQTPSSHTRWPHRTSGTACRRPGNRPARSVDASSPAACCSP